MSLIEPQSVSQLAQTYPRAPGLLRHNLAAEPLLGLPALAEAARALPRQQVERRIHDAANGEAFRLIEADTHPADAIAAGCVDDAWIMLRYIEQLPAYRALFERLLAELAPAIGPATGSASDIKGYVFISAPGTHTPFHFDAEYNILFQIAGDKVFATFPPARPFVDLARREAYHLAGENMLAWRAEYAASAAEHRLSSGDALFVPYCAPHWVHAGDALSVSLSVTWQCRRSRAVADALWLNPVMRRMGLPAYDPEAHPDTHAPWLRAAARRVGERIGLL
jgi:hypothetical protein